MVVFMPNSAHEEFGKAPFCTWPGLGCAPRAQGNSWTWCFEHEPSHALVLPGFLLWDQTPYKWLSQPIIKIRVATSWFKEVQLNGGCNLLLSEPLRNEWHAEEKENSLRFIYLLPSLLQWLDVKMHCMITSPRKALPGMFLKASRNRFWRAWIEKCKIPSTGAHKFC